MHSEIMNITVVIININNLKGKAFLFDASVAQVAQLKVNFFATDNSMTCLMDSVEIIP